jgi:hypothetical protein
LVASLVDTRLNLRDDYLVNNMDLMAWRRTDTGCPGEDLGTRVGGLSEYWGSVQAAQRVLGVDIGSARSS